MMERRDGHSKIVWDKNEGSFKTVDPHPITPPLEYHDPASNMYRSQCKPMTQDQASLLIDYLETMEEITDHQSNMRQMQEIGTNEEELDAACRALAEIAGRTYSLL
jgi:hypothetical protein